MTITLLRKARYMSLGELYHPVAGVLPSGVVAADAVSNNPTDYTVGGKTEVNFRWNDATRHFNNQGQRWMRDIRPTFNGPETYGSVKHCGTPRRVTASGLGLTNEFFPHITEIEFYFTGIEFSIGHMNLGGNGSAGNPGGSTEVYVEQDGEMWSIAATPKHTTRTDGPHSWRNIVFNSWQNRIRIRIVFGSTAFWGIRTSSQTLISPTPNRYIVGLDGDSYTESSQALTFDNVNQWATCTWGNMLFRETGFSVPHFGQGATGFFSNGAAQVFDDTVGSASQLFFFFQVTITGLTRYFSGDGAGNSSRRNWYINSQAMAQALGKPAFTHFAGEYLGGPLGLRPLAHVHVGTWNDASSGFVDYAVMRDRVADCYDWFHSIDPNCRFIHISPEPFNDKMFGPTSTGVGVLGGPRKGARCDDYTRAQIEAASTRDWVKYVNIYGPDEPLWTGMGPAEKTNGGLHNIPANSQQAQLVSPEDSIHGKYEMHRLLGSETADRIADTGVLIERVLGHV